MAKTYQDLLDVGMNESDRMEFVKSAIMAHKSSDLYKTAMIAHQYDIQQNPTIMSFQKMLYKVTGEAVPDIYSANYKLASNIFHRLVTQLVQFELGNGVTWGKPTREVSKPKEGGDYFSEEVWDEELEEYVEKWFLAGTDRKVGLDFDQRLQEIFAEAIDGSVCFGFWNLDHVEVFTVREFCPLYDEENGALMAGIRFWQVASNKPLRATLYELDGYTNYMWKEGEGIILEQKRTYKEVERGAPVDPNKIYDGENYDGFPIIPAWANRNKTAAITGMRENIDCYDLVKSGFANNVDDLSVIFWILNNASGMDEIDCAKFIDTLKRTHTALADAQGVQVSAQTMDIPYASREALLDRIRADIYDDFMALDTKNIADGATTATQIESAYEPMNNKADELEYCVLDFIQSLLKIAGINDKATFTRSIVVNKAEESNIVIASAPFMSEEYTTQKLLTIMGDGDKFSDVMRQKKKEELERLEFGYGEEEEEKTEETSEGGETWTEDIETQNASSES